MNRILILLAVLVAISSAQTFRFIRPVRDNIQTNGSYLYGEPRIGNSSLAHLGLDIAARYDTVFATNSGTITFVGYNPLDTVGGYEPGGGGNYITLRSMWDGKNIYMLYMHLSRPIVTTGAIVSQGQPLAISGTTGNSSGPHLHYEMRMNAAAYATLGSRRNGELWAAMPGMGAIYGFVPNAPNSTRVDITPDPKPRPPYTTYGYSLTYNFSDPYLGSDDIYNENYAIGDVKPGTYTITALGGAYTRTVTVAAGQVMSADPPSIIQDEVVVPNTITLNQNYPNPFNPSTLIRYRLPSDGSVTLKVYNLIGEVVQTLVSGWQTSGEYSVEFPQNGIPLLSSVYFYELQFGSTRILKKMMVIK
jgi:murein DD-endopeptidase MepM/ murein hydrolase activator NlpD